MIACCSSIVSVGVGEGDGVVGGVVVIAIIEASTAMSSLSVGTGDAKMFSRIV